MKLQINIEMDNAAFGEDGTDAGLEVCRILNEYMKSHLMFGKFDKILRDLNGNHVGSTDFRED